MTAQDLYQAGQLEDAIELLGTELRQNPTDTQRRTFLFELLCFAGDLDRAQKQLDMLGGENAQAGMGSLVYQSALHAERTRREMFRTGHFPQTSPAPRAPAGTLNGKPFQTLSDADPRIGARLEIFAAGQYTWMPFEQLLSVEMTAPRRLRDLLWAEAVVRAGSEVQDIELGQVLLPVMAPLSFEHEDSDIRLGRVGDWQELDDGAFAPIGQKMFLVDDEPMPVLELRKLEITPTTSSERH